MVIVFGDGESLLEPRLTGWAMRESLEAGALQTGFTTSGTPSGAAKILERAFGGPLEAPMASATVSLDPHKLRHQPRCRRRLPGSVWEAWRAASQRLRLPVLPPESLCLMEWAWSRGWSLAVNVLVSRELAGLSPLLEELARLGWAEQFNLLAPKPLWSLVPPGSFSSTLLAARALAERLSRHARVTVEPSLGQLLGLARGCVAGERLLSVTACGLVRPCSFSSIGLPWRPGSLEEIWEELKRRASPLRRGSCPYLSR